MSIWKIIAFSAVAITASNLAAAATDGSALAQKYACMSCHQADKRLVGPSYLEISNKYKDGSKSAQQLAASIKAGGSGKWGAIPMPAQPQVPDADALVLANWILTKK